MRWIVGAILLLLAHPAWAQDERPTGYPRSANEAGYLAQLAPWLRVQPDVQYVVYPGGDILVDHAVVAGVRIKVGQ